MRLLAIGVCVLALLPAAASAQQSAASEKGPTIQAASIAFRADNGKASALNVSASPVLRRHAGQDVALMAVGVGAMIVGAVIGDTAGTIIIIGGAAMALFGLYHYLE